MEDKGFACKTHAQTPIEEIHRYFPKLIRYTGPFILTSEVQCWAAQHGGLQNVIQPGVVVLADAYQSVDPTKGQGLVKTMTDVDALCFRCLPRWLNTPGMGSEK